MEELEAVLVELESELSAGNVYSLGERQGLPPAAVDAYRAALVKAVAERDVDNLRSRATAYLRALGLVSS